MTYGRGSGNKYRTQYETRHENSVLHHERTTRRLSRHVAPGHILTTSGPPAGQKMSSNDAWEGDVARFRRPRNRQRRRRRGGSSVRRGRTGSRVKRAQTRQGVTRLGQMSLLIHQSRMSTNFIAKFFGIFSIVT